jgi:exopolysaccharide production protein ExoZ
MTPNAPALARISLVQPNNVGPNLRVGDRINNLQGLRGVAAMFVVFFHSGFVFPGLQPFGSFGVAIFFVMSGYLMAMLCEKQPDAFLRRRFIRIVPPYWAFTLLLFAVALKYPLLLKTTRPDVIELLKSLLFIPFTKSNGIMAPVLFLGWTLNYEMFFYVVVGCCLLVSRRYAGLLSCGVLTAIVMTCRLLGTGDVAGFYSRGLIFEFVAGIACYWLCSRLPWPSTIHTRFVLAAALVASLSAMIYVQGTNVQLPIPSALAVGVLAFLSVLSATLLAKAGWDTRVPAVVMVGDASYLLYLVHPYIEASVQHLTAHHFRWLAPEFAFGCLFSMALCAIVSVVLHLSVERPAIQRLNRLLLPSRIQPKRQQSKPFLPSCVPNPAG